MVLWKLIIIFACVSIAEENDWLNHKPYLGRIFQWLQTKVFFSLSRSIYHIDGLHVYGTIFIAHNISWEICVTGIRSTLDSLHYIACNNFQGATWNTLVLNIWGISLTARIANLVFAREITFTSSCLFYPNIFKCI